MPALGYVIRMFPQVSETFIANEILSLERLGIPLRVYSYRKPTEDVGHECVRQIQTPITYLPQPGRVAAVVPAHISVATAEPTRYRATLLHVLQASADGRTIDPWKRFLQAGYLAQLVERDDIDRLHAHFAHGSTHLAMLTSMLTGVPYSFSAHARDIYNNASPRLLREKIERADLVTTCTRANAEHLRSFVADQHRDKVVTAYHGVNVEKFAYGSREVADSVPTILTVARLVEKKGIDDLLRACGILHGKGIPFRCVIVGEGPQRPRLELQIRALGLDDAVEMAGACVQEDLIERYREATAFVLPCKVLANGDRDGIPNVIAEAMASGVPVVSTDVSGVPELIENGSTGLLVPPGNTVELASAIELLLRDAELRARLAWNARARVEADFESAACARALAGRFGWRAAEAVV